MDNTLLDKSSSMIGLRDLQKSILLMDKTEHCQMMGSSEAKLSIKDPNTHSKPFSKHQLYSLVCFSDY